MTPHPHEVQCSDFLSGSRHRWHLPPLRTNTDTLSTRTLAQSGLYLHSCEQIWQIFAAFFTCMYFHHQQVHAYQGIARNEHISTLGTCCLQLDNCTRLMLTTFRSASHQLLYVIIIIWRDNELCRSLDTAQSVQSVPTLGLKSQSEGKNGHFRAKITVQGQKRPL